MPVFIRTATSISPQNSLDETVFEQSPVAPAGNSMTCIEPDYSLFIDPKQIRRMSRIVRMGVTAALLALKKASVPMPGAIITGTAYGCMEDSTVFLQRMIEYKEELLTPTAFIQSTHNTVAAQIALMLKCHHYNNTIVQGGRSFENAIQDAMMLLREGTRNALVGGIDEMTKDSHAILSRFGLYKHAYAGEGAAFFVLDSEASGSDMCRLEGIKTFYKPADDIVTPTIQSFLESHSISAADIDLVITGANGDPKNDLTYHALAASLLSGKPVFSFKPFCGEYPTASAFGLWLASSILDKQKIPVWFKDPESVKKPLQRILLYNHYQNIHHSLFLIAAC